MKTLLHTTFYVVVLAAAFSAVQSLGQGSLSITFDGPPFAPSAGQSFLVQEYYEADVWFRPIGPVEPGVGFVRTKGGGQFSVPDNSSAYLQALGGDSLQFSFTDDSLFNLIAVDLAEYSMGLPDAVTVLFIGYRGNGSTVTTSFTTDGIIDGTGPLPDFETFYFGNEWTDLMRVEIPTFGWSLDNLVVVIPEPATGALSIVGGFLLWMGRRRL
ncbi:MAG TPA: hypothetical protein PKA41_14480 [Verrucomicrobiota bacterium]|nr:hypothetical protein [Verrucomicrobiota bacterium]